MPITCVSTRDVCARFATEVRHERAFHTGEPSSCGGVRLAGWIWDVSHGNGWRRIDDQDPDRHWPSVAVLRPNSLQPGTVRGGDHLHSSYARRLGRRRCADRRRMTRRRRSGLDFCAPRARRELSHPSDAIDEAAGYTPMTTAPSSTPMPPRASQVATSIALSANSCSPTTTSLGRRQVLCRATTDPLMTSRCLSIPHWSWDGLQG